MVHGGIIICLLDEAMGYAALFEGIHCVTAKMQAKLERPTRVNEPLIITSSITRRTRKLVESIATVSQKDGTTIAEGTATQFVVNSQNREDKSSSNAGK